MTALPAYFSLDGGPEAPPLRKADPGWAPMPLTPRTFSRARQGPWKELNSETQGSFLLKPAIGFDLTGVP